MVASRFLLNVRAVPSSDIQPHTLLAQRSGNTVAKATPSCAADVIHADVLRCKPFCIGEGAYGCFVIRSGLTRFACFVRLNSEGQLPAPLQAMEPTEFGFCFMADSSLSIRTLKRSTSLAKRPAKISSLVVVLELCFPVSAARKQYRTRNMTVATHVTT